MREAISHTLASDPGKLSGCLDAAEITEKLLLNGGAARCRVLAIAYAGEVRECWASPGSKWVGPAPVVLWKRKMGAHQPGVLGRIVPMRLEVQPPMEIRVVQCTKMRKSSPCFPRSR